MDRAETLMAKWLSERGYQYHFEPDDWGVLTCPDFRVVFADQTVAIEVESIRSWGGFANAEPGKVFSRTMDMALRPVRGRIKSAAAQLKPLAVTCMPLVIALANPLNRPVPFGVDMVISAMYGDPSFAFDDDAGRILLGRNGKLTNDHPYVSAVIVIRQAPGVRETAQRWFDENRGHFDTAQEVAQEARRLGAEGAFGDEGAVGIDLVETVGGSPRLPLGFACGPHDTTWGPTADGKGIERKHKGDSAL
jgi:hypothetical protein